MGDFSGVTPTWVIPIQPVFNNIITQSETMKKNYQNLSGSNGIYQYKLKWENMSDTNFWTLYKHNNDNKGQYTSFTWKSVPAYIDADRDGTPDGTNMTGRWVDGSFNFSPNAKSWNAEITFEEDI